MTDPAPAVPPAIAWQTAVVTGIVERTPRIKSFFFRLSQPFVFVAGQHVDVRLTSPDGYRALRSYSIASAPDGSGTIELAIERLQDGEVSPFFHDVVVVGDEIELRGPLGGYFIWPGDDLPLLLAGGGSGVVPLMAMIRHRFASADPRAIVLLYSVRSANEAVFRDELLALDGRHAGFTLIMTLTREAPARPVDFGRRVDAAMMTDVLARVPGAARRVFVCGSNAFVNAAADGAVAAGVPPGDILTERYGV